MPEVFIAHAWYVATFGSSCYGLKVALMAAISRYTQPHKQELVSQLQGSTICFTFTILTLRSRSLATITGDI
jgi:hypothetical protein